MNRIFIVCCFILISCSLQKKVGNKATIIINDSLLHAGFVGISIYDTEIEKSVYRYNADKYFVPASNMKLFTLYAGLQFLPDSLPGIQVFENKDGVYIYPTGDPTFLHPSFHTQRVYDFLKNTTKPLFLVKENNSFKKWGSGWSWDDYEEAFMPERSSFPMYGNVVKIDSNQFSIPVFKDYSIYPVLINNSNDFYSVKRSFDKNLFIFSTITEKQKPVSIPFITSDILVCKLLSDTLHKNISITDTSIIEKETQLYTVNSQNRDSVMALMMKNSDNFIAEQLMLMISKLQYGIMTNNIFDSVSSVAFNDLPQPIKWKDASGLSRYNQCTPDGIIYLLRKLKSKAGMKRMESFLPKGNEGTLKNYFLSEGAAIHAKTGSMSNVYCMSGYIVNKKNKLLIFSILTNNIPGPLSHARKKIESFLKEVRDL